MKILLSIIGFILLIITAVCAINMVTEKRRRSPRAIPSQSDRTAFRIKLVTSIFCGLVGAGLMLSALVIGLKENQEPVTAHSAVESGLIIIDLTQKATTEVSVVPTAIPEETEMTPEELREEFAHMTIHTDDISADAEYGDYSPYILRSSFPAMNGWKSQTLSIIGEPFVGAVSLPMIADQDYYDVASGYVRKTGPNSSGQTVATPTLRQQIEEWQKIFDGLDAETAKNTGFDEIIEEMLRNPVFGDMVATGLAKYCPVLVEVNQEWYPQLLEMFADAYDTSNKGADDPKGVECFITYDTDDQELINSWSAKEKFAHMVRTEEYFYAITPLCDLLKEFENVGYEERKSLHNYELKYNGLTSAARTREADEQEDRLALVLVATGKSEKVEYLIGFNFFDRRLEIFNIGTPVVHPTPTATPTPVNKGQASPSPSAKPTDAPVETSQPTKTAEPTPGRTPEPTDQPTPGPTTEPTPGPTAPPTPGPTTPPTPGPTPGPTDPPPVVTPAPTPPKNTGDTSNSGSGNTGTDQSRGENNDKGNGGSHTDSEEASKGDIDNKVETDKVNQETEQEKKDQMDQWKEETSTDPEGGTVVGGGDETPSVDADHGPGSSGSGTESTDGNASGGGDSGNSGTGGNTSEDRNDTAVEEP